MADDPAARSGPRRSPDDEAMGGSDSSEDRSRPVPGDAGGGLDLLRRLSVRTKALVISSEYTRRQMGPELLRSVLEVLAPSSEERKEAIRAVEEELRAARYPMGEIVRLVGGLSAPSVGSTTVSERRGVKAEAEGAAVPQNPHVVVTRKVRSPNLMPFERFEFETPEPGREAPSAQEEGGKPDGAAEWEVEEEFDVKPGGEIEVKSQQAQAKPEEKADRAAEEETDVREKPAAAGASPERPDVRPAGAPSQPRFVSGGETAPPEGEGFAEGFRDLAGVGVGSAPRSGGRTRGPAVLVADDDGRARMMYRAKLEESGFAVVEAKDGIEAWKHIRGGAVQCAVMDMKMPGYHGLEVLSRMVDSGQVIPVVVVSAFDQLANEFVVATYPQLKFLAKPASPERVAEAVKAFLRRGKGVGT